MKRFIICLAATAAMLLLLTASCDCGSDPEDEVVPTIAVISSGNAMLVGEVVEAQVKIKAVPEVAGLGFKLNYDPYKLEIVSLTRDDSWLASGGGTIQQMALNTFNEAGYAKVVLAIFPTTNAVGDEEDAYHSVLSIRVRAKSAGNATLSISIDNSTDSDLGVFKANGELWTGIATANHSWSVTNSK